MVHVVGDGGAEFGISSCRAISGESLVQGLMGRLADELRGVEVRLTSAEAANVPSFGLQCFGSSCNLKSQRRLEGLGPV